MTDRDAEGWQDRADVLMEAVRAAAAAAWRHGVAVEAIEAAAWGGARPAAIADGQRERFNGGRRA